MTEKLLSIVIPTKDREVYCKAVLDYMLTIKDDRIEFIIQDNSANDVLEQYIAKLDDVRLVYNHESAPLCQVDNSDHAIALATGEYICFIGDDDIILPNIMEVVSFARHNNIDSIAQKTPICYMWPSDLYPTGLLIYSKYQESVEKISDLVKCVNKYFSEGCCVNPRNFKLPTIYHGLIRRDCVNKIKKITGHYVGGVSPDSYTSVALALTVNNHFIIDRPFTVAGACPLSATAINAKGHHCGELSVAPHLKHRTNYVWSKDIPEYYSVQTVWSESSVKAVHEIGYSDKFILSDSKLFSNAFLYNPSIRKLIIDRTKACMQQKNGDTFTFWITCFINLFFLFINRKWNNLIEITTSKWKGDKLDHIQNVHDITECVNLVLAIMEK